MDSNHDIASLPPLRAEFAGGTFRGITTRKDGTHCAVILLPNKATEQRNWQACVDWAREAGGELPTRTVFHLLRLSATKEELAEGGWYYTADLLSDDTGNADDAAYAWDCYLGNGTTLNFRKSYEGLAVAVRLIPLTSPAKVGGDDLDTLLGKYWELAYDEGKNGVSHGDAANLVLHQLREVARVAKVGGDEREAAFNRIMGDPSMPDSDETTYDMWLFDKAWEAAMQARAALSADGGEDKRDAAWSKWILDPKFYDWNTTEQCAALHFNAGFDAANQARKGE